MANTHATNKNRRARLLAHKERALQRTGEQTPAENAEHYKAIKELKALQVNGVRYGNHRSMRAHEKVVGRCHQRKVLGRELRSTVEQEV
jgi:hypothetical protein